MEYNESTRNVSLEEVIAALTHTDWQVRARAVHMLVPFGDAFPIELLKKALLDTHKAVRVAALEVCAILPQRIPVALVEACLSDPYWSVRAAAAYALGKFGCEAPVARLLTLLKDFEESSLVRSSALQAVGMLQGRDRHQRIIQALHDPAWHVREIAALLLGWLEEKRAISTLIEVFHSDPDSFVRSATIIALGQMKDERVEEILRDALQDTDLYVRDAAQKTLND